MAATGSQRFDGFEITLYEGKFQGSFDMDEGLAEDLRFDDSVTFIVTGRIGGVQLAETKLGDLKRVNTFQVASTTALDPQTATKVLNSLGQMVSGVNAGQMKLGQDPTATLDDDEVDLSDRTVGSLPGPSAGGIPVTDDVLAKFLSQ